MSDEEKKDEPQQEVLNEPETTTEQGDSRIDQMLASMQSLQEQVSSMQNSMAMFVESGGTIREGDMQPDDVGNQDDFEYVPIDDLDLF